MILTVGLSNLMPKTGNSTLCGCYRGDHKAIYRGDYPYLFDIPGGPLRKSQQIGV